MRTDTSRRAFLRQALLAGAAVGAAGLVPPFARRTRAFGDPAAGAGGGAPLKVLVLGGTGQTGPHLIEELQRRGHIVTMFNRGNRSEDLFPGVECLLGDREPGAVDGLKSLADAIAAGRRWDLCIDIWPQIPKMVETTAVLLKGSIGHYMFVSSISVYTDFATPGADETAAVAQAPGADTLTYTDELFGPFKAECENRVRRHYPDHHTIFRPGLIVGPRDASFRGGYWPVRVRRGGEVLAPGDGTTAIQIIDGRDLTAFEALCMERRTVGTFDVTGPVPAQPLTMKNYLETCRQVGGSDAAFVWADPAFLDANGIGPWRDLPCWLPDDADYAGFGRRNPAKAVAAGLVYRPLAETVRDTLAWYDGLAPEKREAVTKRAGLTAEREAAALQAWHTLHG